MNLLFTNQMFKLFSVFILFFTLLSPACAALPTVDITQPNHQIGHAISFYEDVNHHVEFSHITELPIDNFKPLKQDVSAHLFTNSTFYYKFDVTNPQIQSLSRLLVFETPWLDDIKIKVISPNSTIQQYSTGNIYPFSQRAVAHPYPNIEHLFEPGISTVYVQVKTRDPFIVPISIIDRETLFKDQVLHVSVTAFMYGIIIAMLLYHLILFVSIKLRYYAFYALYLATFLMANVSYHGYTFQFLLGDYPTIQNWLQSTTIFLFSISGLLFAKSFLNLKKYLPSAQKSMNAFILIFIGTMLFSALFGYHIHIILAITMAILFSIYVFSIALLSLLNGNQSALFFLLGTTAGLIGTSITALTVMALVPYTRIGYQAIEIGMVVDSILLSFALVNRVKINEKDKQIAEFFAKTDALTNLPNRRAYNDICHQEQSLTNKIHHTQLSALMIDIDFFKLVNDTYGHETGDIVLQRIARLLQNSIKTSDYIFRLGGEEFLILLPDTQVNQTKEIAERIRSTVENMEILDKTQPIKITVSIGVSIHITPDKCIIEAVRTADSLLYRAKQSGRNQVMVATFNPLVSNGLSLQNADQALRHD